MQKNTLVKAPACFQLDAPDSICGWKRIESAHVVRGTTACNTEKETRDEINVAEQLRWQITDSRSMSKLHIR
jgi:hypothetical protein